MLTVSAAQLERRKRGGAHEFDHFDADDVLEELDEVFVGVLDAGADKDHRADFGRVDVARFEGESRHGDEEEEGVAV